MPDFPSCAAVTNGEEHPDSKHPPHPVSKEEKGMSKAKQDGHGLAQADGVTNTDDSDKPYTTSLKSQPQTVQRKPFVPREDEELIDVGTARANIAASKEQPDGTQERGWAERHDNETVVQQHAAYWDADHDGVIWPLDTYRGCRRWGWNPFLCLLATFIINFNLFYPTGSSWLPDPFFRIYLDKLYKDKHGSDSMSFDNEGRFRPQQFEDFFAKYDKGNKGGLDVMDLLRAHKGQRFVFDFFGWSASFFEWFATYLLLWPDDGILRKEDVRRVFDGSIFEWKAEEYEAKQRRKGRGGHGKLRLM